MGHWWRWPWGVVAAALLAACSGPVDPGAEPGTGRVTVSLGRTARAGRAAPAVGPGLPDDVERIEITCTGPGMDPVSGDLPLDGTPLVLVIPAGRDRLFSADAWAGTTHRMAGSTLLPSLGVNETATVSITVEELGTITFSAPPPGALRVSETTTLAVDLTGFENPAVVWTVNGVTGGNAAVGTITDDGTYTAPDAVPTPAEVAIRVASALAPDLYAEARVTIEPPLACGTLTVDSTADAVDADPGDGVCADASGACTLRAAVQEANACPGDQEIVLPAGTYTLTLAGAGEGAAATGDLDIYGDVTLTGAGAGSTVIDGGGLDRVAELRGAVTLQDLRIRNGGNVRYGGGISVTGSGTATVSRCVVENNGATEGGGGLVVGEGGVLTVVDTAVSGNSARYGAGIHNYVGEVTLERSTVSGNTATQQGGGINNQGGTLTVVNGTISGNQGGLTGGGLMNYAAATATLTHVTVAGNAASVGAGIDNDASQGAGTVTLVNSLVADSSGGSDCANAGQLVVTASLDTDGSCGDATTADPLLAALADNGGPTWTHALAAGSPAIDAGDAAACPATDQRGFPRDDGACDLGAVEFQSSGVVVVVSPTTATVAPGGTTAFSASVAGSPDTTVTWAVEGSTCTDPGTVAADGTYTAGDPAADCTETVRATSNADPTQSATAAVTVDAPVAVAVSPGSATVAPGGSHAFAAAVTGDTDTSVTWAVVGTTCTDPGTVAADGTYTAGSPADDCAETVRATSNADPTQSATATVTVDAPVAVAVSPGSATVAPGGSYAFAAAVTGDADTAVTWTVEGSTCTDPGTVTPDGTYTAGDPAADCTETVRATSNADNTKSAAATVTVDAPVAVAVSPGSATVAPGGSQAFAAAVIGDAETTVAWTVEGSTCTDPGTVAADGTYTAGSPAVDCAETVRATSNADNTKSATAAVTVNVAVAVTVTGPAAVQLGSTAGFSATVTGDADTAVEWYVNDVAGGDATVGTIAADGTYTPPAAVPSPDTVTVKAVSVADGTASDEVSLRVLSVTCLGGYLLVDSTSDASDANPGDGLCADVDTAACTLRAAIEEANACEGADVVEVPAGTYVLTLGGLGITDDLTVSGAGAGSTIVDGNAASRVFSVGTVAAATFENLAIRNGNVSGSGGGVSSGATRVTFRGVFLTGNVATSLGGGFYTWTGTAVFEDSEISHNSAGSGGGITFANSTLVLVNATVSYNVGDSWPYYAAGIFDYSNSPSNLTIENSTVVGNTGRGVLLYEAQTTVTNSTITNNTREGIRAERNAAASLTNSILYGNGPNCSTNGGTITSGGHNIDSRNSCGFAAAGDLVNTDPKLGPLADNGGPTRTRGLLAGSPALDAGDDGVCPATDQRGVARTDGACDIGAVEGQVADVTCLQANGGADPTVDSTGDAVDADIGDGVCADASGNCTLRAAIQETNACAGRDAITLPAGTYALTLVGSGEDAGATGDLDVTDDLAIQGAGAATTVIDGSAPFDDRIFHVLNDVPTTFDGLTLQNVDIASSGGGIATGGDLTVRNAAISDNTGGDGTGINAWSPVATVTVTDTTMSNNTSTGSYGGAIRVEGTLNLSGSTLSGNTMPYAYGHYGAAIYGGAGSTINITDTLLDNNAAGYAEAVRGADNATINITDSTISNTQAGRAVTGSSGSTINIVRSQIVDNLEGGVSSTGAGAVLNVVDSTIDGNTGTAVGSFSFSGAGIYSDGTVTITGSTISNNRIESTLGGGGGGAGVFIAGTATIVNATFSGNVNNGTNSAGGAISSTDSGDLSLRNTTFHANQSTWTGGHIASSGNVEMANTVFSAGDCDLTGAAVVSNGTNIDSGSTCGSAAAGDLVNTDPQLGPLADNGGPTWTLLPQGGSPAIDAGDDGVCPATDQRGVSRPQDGDGDGTAACDIGAVEVEPQFL
ncbi:choice-of-anchor Q domain-containing protein [Deferrisoma camini]|uniref:choice-of-anchor Q domain-containing protein n=1 Tax=Deferrisoma camini TaxID=1035120 RepID=UPI00046C901C|nr:choice-of-anchor Q domain-containing protein [Deferrisoma camini]